MTVFYDTIGLVGSFVVSGSLVPQMVKVYRTKSASDLSFTFQCSYVIGLTMILIYGFGEALWPIYIPCSIEFLGATSLLIMKQIYDARERESPPKGTTEASLELESGSDRKFHAILTPQ